MFRLIDPADSCKDTAEDIKEYLQKVDYKIIQQMLSEIFKIYQPETEYEEPGESKLYNTYSFVTTYLASAVTNAIHTISRPRAKDLEKAIQEINQDNIIEMVSSILGKEGGGFKTTSVNSLLLHRLIKNLDGYDDQAIVSEENLKRINKLLMEKLDQIVLENTIIQDKKDLQTIKDNYEKFRIETIRGLRAMELQILGKKQELYLNEISYCQLHDSNCDVIDMETDESINIQKKNEFDKCLCILVNDYNNMVSQKNELRNNFIEVKNKYLKISNNNNHGLISEILQSIDADKDDLDVIMENELELNDAITKTKASQQLAFEAASKRDRKDDTSTRKLLFNKLIAARDHTNLMLNNSNLVGSSLRYSLSQTIYLSPSSSSSGQEYSSEEKNSINFSNK